MSGSSNTPIRVSNQSMPTGHVIKTIAYQAALASSGTDELDLQQQFTHGQMDQIQAVFVDNSQNTSAFELVCNVTQMRVILPPNSQGWIPILVTQNPVFRFASAGAVNVPLFFTNVPMPVGVWGVLDSNGGGGGGSFIELEA